jgi:hypothetical protein
MRLAICSLIAISTSLLPPSSAAAEIEAQFWIIRADYQTADAIANASSNPKITSVKFEQRPPTSSVDLRKIPPIS